MDVTFSLLYDLHLKNDDISKSDIFFTVTHAFLVQNGFRCIGTEEMEQNPSTALPNGWNAQRPVYALRYEHNKKLFTLKANVENSEMMFKLKMDGNFPEKTTKVDLEQTVKSMEGPCLETVVPDIQNVVVNFQQDLLEPVRMLGGLRLKDILCLKFVGPGILIIVTSIILWGYGIFDATK